MHGRLLGFLAPFQVRGHVLQDHDGIVHHHTNGNGQSRHRDDIQRITRCQQVQQRSQQGDRDTQHHDEGTPPAAQEDIHHQHYHQEGNHNGFLQGIDGVNDVVRRIHDRHEGDIRRKGLLDVLHRLLHVADYLDGIVSGLLLDNDLGTTGAVRIGFLRFLLQAVVHTGHVAQVHVAARSGMSHDQVQQLGGILEFLLNAQVICLGTDIDVSRRNIPVLGRDDAGNGADAQTIGIQLGRIAIHLDFALGRTGDGHRTHTRNAGQRGGDPVVQDLVHGGHALTGGRRQDQDRHIVRAELEDDRR